jgi:Leucine-rich repeat (LRR) protein
LRRFLRRISEEASRLQHLQILEIEHCPMLAGLPTSTGLLKQLQHLSLIDCDGITKLPDSLGNLTQLITLRLSLRHLTRFPVSLSSLTSLVHYSCKDVPFQAFSAIPSPHLMTLTLRLEMPDISGMPQEVLQPFIDSMRSVSVLSFVLLCFASALIPGCVIVLCSQHDACLCAVQPA